MTNKGAKLQDRSGRREMANAYDPKTAVGGLPDADAALLARRQRTLGRLAPLFYQQPVHVVSGRGAHLFGPQGEDYLDCYNNVACVGHANPHVRQAVADQLSRQDTHTRYLQDEVVSYAERLLAHFAPPTEQSSGPAGEGGGTVEPSLGPLNRVAFTNSGSESNDLALRMARTFTGRRGVVVTANAYHGITALVASVSPSFGTALPLAPFLATVEVADVLRHPGPDAATVLLRRFEQAFQRLHDAGYGVCAVLMDQIFSSDGVLPDPAGWERAVADAAHREGGLLIADEVQSGFARTGDAFWGFQRHHADADLVSIGKPMGNGIPAGGVVYKAPIGDAFAECTRYFNTFGGNPVSMRAAAAVLDEIEERGLQCHARVIGGRIASSLSAVLGGLPGFGGIRHAGLFIGIDVRDRNDPLRPDPDATLRIISALRERRALISASGVDASTLKVRPPLVFSAADADRLADAFVSVRRDGLFG